MDLARDVVLSELEEDPLLMELEISLLEMLLEEGKEKISLVSLTQLTQIRVLFLAPSKASTLILPPYPA